MDQYGTAGGIGYLLGAGHDRADPTRQAAEFEGDLADEPLHAEQRRVVRLVIDARAHRQQRREAHAAHDVIPRRAQPRQEGCNWRAISHDGIVQKREHGASS